MKAMTNIIAPLPAVPLEPGSCLALKCAEGHAYVCTCTRYDYCAHLSHLPDQTRIFLEPTCHCGHARHNHTGALAEAHAADRSQDDDDDTVEQTVEGGEAAELADLAEELATSAEHISKRLNHDDWESRFVARAERARLVGGFVLFLLCWLCSAAMVWLIAKG